MSKIQYSLPAGVTELGSPDISPDYPTGRLATASDEGRGEPGLDFGRSLGGHSLLSRSSLPQGRRSLFRR